MLLDFFNDFLKYVSLLMIFLNFLFLKGFVFFVNLVNGFILVKLYRFCSIRNFCIF